MARVKPLFCAWPIGFPVALRRYRGIGLLVVLSILLSGCAGIGGDGVFGSVDQTGGGRYSQRYDAHPDDPPDVSGVPYAVPRVESPSRYGNPRRYTVRGQSYAVMSSSRGYTAEGLASWYGTKFHGHKTSNGEVYDMYKMTAAHKTLPLPTYLKVTNLDNGRTAIVRVNDRGPFHGNRLIDLSYAAASKLGYLHKGTAHVRIEAIDPQRWLEARRRAQRQASGDDDEPVYLQVASLSNPQAAQRLKTRMQQMLNLPVKVMPSYGVKTWYRVRIGPLKDTESIERASQAIADTELGDPLVVRSDS